MHYEKCVKSLSKAVVGEGMTLAVGEGEFGLWHARTTTKISYAAGPPARA